MSMKLESQVCSLDLAKRLKELGVKQESLFHHVSYLNLGVEERDIYSDEKVTSAGKDGWQLTSIYSAFTVAELGEMLPEQIYVNNIWYFSRQFIRKGSVRGYIIQYASNAGTIFGNQNENTEADARAKMLVYLLENHLLDTTK